MNRPLLMVFAKAPEPGAVKTRLTGILTDQEASDLYEAFLRDALTGYAALPAEVAVYFPNPSRVAPALVPGSMAIRTQKGADLGERMRRAFEDAFNDGRRRVMIVGSDHPTLPLSVFEHGFRSLETPNSVCIGPSSDGGYYLLGMNRFYPELFGGMTYSHPGVFGETMARLETLKAQTEVWTQVLSEWYDVDTPEDLRRLLREIDETAQPLPHTRGVLQRLAGTYPSLRVALGGIRPDVSHLQGKTQ